MLTKKMQRPLWNRSFDRPDVRYIGELNRIVGFSCKGILDAGCGFNSSVQNLQHHPKCLIGVDGFLPAIESRAKHIHNEYNRVSLLDNHETFGFESFDCVLTSEVNEYFNEGV